ncbi:hypothetical protein DPMN_173490 [Dreissena polymorpha]|uniref:Uncharacterized protein n=1 Tax=Dreissena polymorpha TaxID=45954 RepID=A0A9D4E3J1_DREPO|nr:hypothetical protein DPMN_173490 [Dreissena polymorpha]
MNKRGAPGLVMGPCIVEIDRIVIREVHVGGDNGEDNHIIPRSNSELLCDNAFEEVPVDLLIYLKEDGNQAAFTFINGPGWVMGTWMVEIDLVVIRDVYVGGDSGQGRLTDSGDQYNIPTLLKAWG